MIFPIRKTAALVLAAAMAYALPAVSGGLDNLQKKVEAAAAEKGIKAPDVRQELLGNPPTSKPVPAPAVVTIESEFLRAVDAGNGNLLFILDNGRFALAGKMVDVWERKELKSIADIEEAVNRIHLEKIGFDLNKVNHFSVGEGGKHVTLFVDPQCGWCHKLMLEIAGKPQLTNTYTFDFVVVPVLGSKSEQLAERLFCAKKTDDAAKFRAMLGGAAAVEALAKEESCDRTVMEQTRVIAGAIGIQSVPMVIADDGRFEKGMPQDLTAFLENRQPPKSVLVKNNAPAGRPVPQQESVNLSKLGFELSRSNHMAVGTGPKHITVFVDPLCSWCHKLMDEISAKPELQKNYTFDFVVVPVLGPNSDALSKKLFCAKDQDAGRRFKALSEGSEAINALEQASKCDEAAFAGTVTEARKSGVGAVPMLVADDGRVARGKPRNLEAFLENMQGVSASAPKPPAGEEKIDLVKTGFTLAKTNHLSVGKGNRHITVFVDPLCAWCHKLMDEIKAEPALQNEFTFDVVVVPVLGPRSEALSKKLYCAEDQTDLKRWEALTGGSEAISATKTAENCSDALYAAANAEARKSTVQAVPLLIADDGRVSRGKPRDLKAFLKPAAK